MGLRPLYLILDIFTSTPLIRPCCTLLYPYHLSLTHFSLLFLFIRVAFTSTPLIHPFYTLLNPTNSSLQHLPQLHSSSTPLLHLCYTPTELHSSTHAALSPSPSHPPLLNFYLLFSSTLDALSPKSTHPPILHSP